MKYILLIMLLQLFQFSLCPPPPGTPFPPVISPPPTYLTSMACACKFFGFSVSYTVLNLPLSILYLPILLLIPCTFYPSPCPPPCL